MAVAKQDPASACGVADRAVLAAAVIVTLLHAARLRPYCRETQVLGDTWSPHAMASENGKVIAWCRGLRSPLRTLWPEIKDYS